MQYETGLPDWFFLDWSSDNAYDINVKYACVTTNLLDLRAGPRFESERLSQLLFGEVVRTGGVRAGYCRIVQPDGYAGWVDRRFLSGVAASRAQQYQSNTNYVVTAPQARLYEAGSRQAPPPHFVYYGTRLWCRRNRNGVALGELADGYPVRLNRNHLKPIKTIKKEALTPRSIVREASRFLGVPYLWGGISPAGFDCSGLVRSVFGRFDIYLPRDTKDQEKVGVLVDRCNIKPGDLLFFKRHVALALGRNRILHASVGGSGVRINSLALDDDDYRADLDRDFAGARRIL